MKFLKAILKHLQTSKATGTCNSNNNSSNNACCYNSPQKLFLVHLPNEILSIVILELLNEWCLMKSVHNRYIRGLLDILPISPEISTKRMIPLSKVNKLFYCLVWTVTLKHSYWNQNPYKQHGSVWGMYFLKMEPFVFTKKNGTILGYRAGEYVLYKRTYSPTSPRLCPQAMFRVYAIFGFIDRNRNK